MSVAPPDRRYQSVSSKVWEEFENTMKSILQVIRHEHMLEGDSSLSSRLAIATRVPLVDPINVLQVRPSAGSA